MEPTAEAEPPTPQPPPGNPVNEPPRAPGPDPGPQTAKEEWRRIMRAKRRAALDPGAAQALAKNLLSAGLIAPAPIVSGYAAVGDELDLDPLLQGLAERGCRTALPVVMGPRGTPLSFRAWRPGEPLQPAGFGLRVPLEGAPLVEPEVLLLPCLAADKTGVRLGQGGGYYDATLRSLRARRPVLAIACIYSVQLVERLPFGPGDERVDWIATEQGVVAAHPG